MLIYAHRGASADYPELTAAAYEGAVAQGADGFECDVRLSKDGVPVLWHNATMLERAGVRGLIAEMTFAEISRAYPDVLTLDAFLDIALEYKKGVLIETKHPVITGNLVEEKVIELLHAKKVFSTIDVSMMSMSWLALEKVKRIDPTIHTTFIMNIAARWTQGEHSSAKALAPSIEKIRSHEELAGKVINAGRNLYVWTVNHESDIKLCNRLGVDILITNKPAHAREVLRYP